MPHVFELAPSARAKCRGCDQKIAKGELRFGERQPNAFGEGEMTLWFHPRCAAYKRPEPFLEALGDEQADAVVAKEVAAVANELRAAAELGIENRRLPRVAAADLAPTGRARCRSCRELIEKDSWRIALVFFEEYRFQPSGFIHVACARKYLGTTEVLDRVRHFNRELDETELDELKRVLEASNPG